MLKVYIEFKIIPDKHTDFLALLPELRRTSHEQEVQGHQMFEGTDQPGLVVEEFLVKDMDHYRHIKAERLDENHPFWKQVHDCIQGGAPKLHIWAFKSLN